MFKISRGTKIVFSISFFIALILVISAYLYYQNINSAEDPRTIKARNLFIDYDNFLEEKEYEKALNILDEIENIYTNLKEYKNSFEFGVVYNNRATVYILIALYSENDETKDKKALLEIAEKNTLESIKIYENWLKSNGKKTKKEIFKKIDEIFKKENFIIDDEDFYFLKNKRVEDIILAQIETPRRLSVSYTNLGTIQRHQLKQELALKSFTKALKLWKYNHTAKNNLNVLIGKSIEDESIIRKLFPPDRMKLDN
ncbi:MAG: hypothetical protein B6I24_03835 [Bacteroidetes bacterium 4572_128]|nr:MAG: hypothetical protein B6I24_03835 [Bacteroidetes bacterium 4572_128]